MRHRAFRVRFRNIGKSFLCRRVGKGMQKRYSTLEVFLFFVRARRRKLNCAEFLGHGMFMFVS